MRAATRWSKLERALAAALRALDGHVVILDVKRTSLYVQLRVTEDAVRAEAVSNAWLPERERLGEAQVAALVALGWSAPTSTPDEPPSPGSEGSPNFFCHYARPLRFQQVARLLVRTLSDVFRVPGPDRLEYRAFDGEGLPVALPALGIPARAPGRHERGGEGRAARLAGLRRRVLAELRRGTGSPALDFDADGDAAVLLGDGALTAFVRVIPEPRSVRVWTILARDVDPTPDLLARVHELDAELVLARLVVVHRAVFLGVDVPGAPFRIEHLRAALRAVGAVARDVGPRIEAARGVHEAPLE